MNDTPTCQQLASRFGLRKHGRSWRGACPLCGYSDTMSVTQGRNGEPLITLYCGCRRADLFALTGQAVQAQRAFEQAGNKTATRLQVREAALRTWERSERLPGTPACSYLVFRNVPHLVSCPDLRFSGQTSHPGGGRLPAMIALVRGAAGEPCAIHRTYLQRDGHGKADITPAKATHGSYWGGAIQLDPPAEALVIGEGIETAAAGRLLTGLPAWAAINAGNLARGLVLPISVRSIVILVDRDPAGEDAAHCARRRWLAEGRHVQLFAPELPGQDAADMLQARQVTHA